MGDRRKLQGEIDRCIKKIQEGVSNFDDILYKLQTAQNSNQREKYECEMKKEIKRLQRNRESIKVWLSTNEIKDKEALLEARRLIENQMEKFKQIERETKTKTFLKNGLNKNKAIADQQRKSEFRSWTNDILSQLKQWIEEYEAETEAMKTTRSKKLQKENMIRQKFIEKHIGNHNFHITSLEKLLRLVENETISLDDAEGVKDDIMYYVEFHLDENFIENDSIYECLDLETSRALKSGTSEVQKLDSKHSNKDSTGDSEVCALSFTVKQGTESKVVKPEKIEDIVMKDIESAALCSTPERNVSNKQRGDSKHFFEKIKVVSDSATLIPIYPPFKASVSQSNSCTKQEFNKRDNIKYDSNKYELNETTNRKGGQGENEGKIIGTKSDQTNYKREHRNGKSSDMDENRYENNCEIDSEEINIEELNAGIGYDSDITENEKLILKEFDDFNNFDNSNYNETILSTTHTLTHCLTSAMLDESAQHSFPYENSLFLDPSFYNKLTNKLLTFIFYYYQGSYAQYMAAKVLKDRDWRFHTGVKTWFRRNSEPDVQTADFEEASYSYYNYDNWERIYNESFRFDYDLMEDKRLL